MELLLDTGWESISSKRLDRDATTITRGKGSGDGVASPARGNVTVNNTGGVLSPRNAASVLYGRIGRNTLLRYGVGIGQYGMAVTNTDTAGDGSGAETTDKAQLDITGDIDIRVDLQVNAPSTWLGASADYDLASKIGPNADPSRSWTLIMIDGTIRFQWFPLGTVASLVTAVSGALTGAATGRRAIRVTLDVDNGAAGNTVQFYTAPTIAGPWTAFGAPIVQAGVTSIFNSNAPLRVGGAAVQSLYSWSYPAWATYYAAEVRNGINGTIVAAPDFTAQPIDPGPFGSPTFADGVGNSWVMQPTAYPTELARIWWGDVRTRAVMEIAELPPKWDPSHSDKYVPLALGGVLRRYGQGKSPVATGLRDFVLARPQALTSYYPLDGKEGTLYSLNLGATYRLGTRFYGQAVLNGASVQNPVFTYGKDMGASWLGSGMELNATGNAYMRGDCGTGDPNAAFEFLYQSPALGVLTVQLQDYNVNLWSLVLDTSTNDGTLQVSFTDPAVGPIGFLTVGPFAELQDAGVHHCRFQLTTVGADTQFAVYIDGTLRSSGTMAGYTWNGTALFRLFYSRYVNQTVMNLAHLILWAEANPANIPLIADTYLAATGYAGETAGARLTRVAAAGNIPLKIVGALASTTVMGPQYSEPRLAQLRDAEAADFGILTEQRDAIGLLYRTRASMYAQTPLIIDYSAKVVAPPFEPTDDDQSTRNDVTASRRDGGSYQIVQTTGRLSVSDPPVGIGRYEDEVTVNVQTDAQLSGAASWWLKLGTLDAARYPSVTFNLAASAITPILRDQILALDVGDRLSIINITLADIPDTVDLIVQGSTETISNDSWSITFNCAPGEPYQVAKFSGASRYDADGSQLTAGIGTTDLSFQVTQTKTSLWTIDPTMFPLDVNMAGERITVSGITSATSPQTFAVSARSVNGVVKTHLAGEAVRLWDTPRYAY